MGSCVMCHKTKVKCINSSGFPCTRCTRLKLECVPHVSRQGRGRSNPKARNSKRSASLTQGVDDSDSVASKKCGPQVAEIGIQVSLPLRPEQFDDADEYGEEFDTNLTKPTVDAHFVRAMPKKIGKDHYGMLHLLRSWLAFALRCRSFELMAKAAQLALKTGLSMDDLFDTKIGAMAAPSIKETGNRDNVDNPPSATDPAMEELGNLFAKPRHQQQTTGTKLLLEEVPLHHRQAANMVTMNDVSDRWIIMRDHDVGVVRFFVSPHFSKDVMTWETIDKTWKISPGELKELFVYGEESRKKMGLAFFQNFYAWKDPDTEPHFTRVQNMTIFLSSTHEVVPVDCYIWISLDRMDHAVAHMEFVPLDGRLSQGRNHAKYEEQQRLSGHVDQRLNHFLGHPTEEDQPMNPNKKRRWSPLLIIQSSIGEQPVADEAHSELSRLAAVSAQTPPINLNNWKGTEPALPSGESENLGAILGEEVEAEDWMLALESLY